MPWGPGNAFGKAVSANTPGKKKPVANTGVKKNVGRFTPQAIDRAMQRGKKSKTGDEHDYR